jgi:hypothetical protein
MLTALEDDVEPVQGLVEKKLDRSTLEQDSLTLLISDVIKVVKPP